MRKNRKTRVARVMRRRREEFRRRVIEKCKEGIACFSLVVVSEATLFAFLLM